LKPSNQEFLKKVLLVSTFLFLGTLAVLVSFYFKNYLSRDGGQAKLPGPALDVVSALQASPIVNYQGATIDLDLSATEQQTLVLHFWASWCEPCITEIPEFLESIEHSRAALISGKAEDRDSGLNPSSVQSDVRYFAISLDDNKEDLTRFLKNFPKLDSENLVRIWDPESTLSARFKIEKLPATIIKLPNNQIKRIDGIVDWKNIKF